MTLKICTDRLTLIKEYGRVRPWLLAAMAHGDGRMSEASLMFNLMTANYLLWTTPLSAMVVQIAEEPINNWREAYVVMAGGNLEDIQNAEPALTQWATDNNCSQIEISGRPGWQRALKDYGYEVSSVHLVKKLKGTADG